MMALRLPVIRKSSWTAMWLSVAISVLAVLALTLLPKKAPLIVFDLVTEYLVQEVTRPELSAMAVSGARISDIAGCEALLGPPLFEGIVQPQTGSRVAYSWRPDELAVSIDSSGVGPTRLVGPDEAECALTGPVISMTIASPPLGARLPLAGTAEIGREFGAANLGAGRDALRRGSFQVFGRSIAPWASDVLYPITSNAISVPSGSRLTVSGASGTDRPWFGVATYTGEGFEVSATADANQIGLYRPGAVAQSERFAFGVFSDFFGDPHIGLIFFGIFVIVTVLQLITGWMGLWPDPPKPKA